MFPYSMLTALSIYYYSHLGRLFLLFLFLLFIINNSFFRMNGKIDAISRRVTGGGGGGSGRGVSDGEIDQIILR